MAWRTTILPRGDDDSLKIDPPLRTARWMPQAQIRAALGTDGIPSAGDALILGYSGIGADRKLVSFQDDRHAIVPVGSRGGKSESFIVPNLLTYRGSVIVTDLKGELAAITAKHRETVLKQRVIVLDPFEVLLGYGRGDLVRGRYNPLEWIDPLDRELIDEAAFLAESIVVKEPREQHFSETAKAYLKSIILFILSGGCDSKRDLIAMRELAMSGIEGRGIPHLLSRLVTSKAANGAIARSASMINSMGDREFGSVISTVGRNTEFLDSPGIASVLTGASSFDPRTLKEEPTTIYLVLPEWRLASHGRWMRLMLVSLLSHLQRAATRRDDLRTLILIDEFPSLGHLEAIERASSYIAGFGVKLAIIVQDLSQLAAIYGRDRWQTFVANSGLVMAFANADMMTAEYLSKRCGETEVLKLKHSINEANSSSRQSGGLFRKLETLFTGHGLGAIGHQSQQHGTSRTSSLNPEMMAAPLITPDEVMAHFARETGAAMVFINGARPMRLERIQYWSDPLFKGLAGPSPFHPAPSEENST